MSDPRLHLDALAAGYDGNAVVRDLTLSVAPGEVVALLGANGAGKTTTLSTIAGLAGGPCHEAGTPRVLQLVRAKATLAGLAVHQRVDESTDVPTRLPHARVHENRRIDPFDIAPRTDHRVPPPLSSGHSVLDCLSKSKRGT